MNNDWQEHDVARVLEQFDPQPSAHFRKRMQSEPWMEETMTTQTHVAPKRRWKPAIGLLVMMVFAGVVLVTPPLRAVAQDMLALIPRHNSNVITDQQLDEYVSKLTALQWSLTFAEAEQRAGFDVWVPSNLPDGYQLRDVGHSSTGNVVVTKYSTGDGSTQYEGELPTLALWQEPAAQGATAAMLPAGATANVETVQIGEATGEYVQGAWSRPVDSEEAWSWSADGWGDSWSRSVSWQQGEWVFVLTASGDPDMFSREQMIAVAANLVPSGE